MSPIHLPPTDKTPEVRFDPGTGLLELTGCSIHENAEAFFRPVMQQLEQYLLQPAPQTKVRLALTYFNSSSSKYILDLLRIVDEAHATGASRASVEWLYDQDDLDMQEAGEDYRTLLDMPVELVCRPIP